MSLDNGNLRSREDVFFALFSKLQLVYIHKCVSFHRLQLRHALGLLAKQVSGVARMLRLIILSSK